VLHAFAGSGEGLMARGLSEMSIATRFDLLIAAGCPPFIGVIPDAMTTLGGSQYMDSPAIGPYASYVTQEVMPYVEGKFRVTGDWAALGRSSGGYGSLRLAMEHPGRFQAIGCLAGDMGFDLCYLGDISKAVSGIQAAGGIEHFVEYFWSQKRPGAQQFAALNIVAMSCAYSPNTGSTPVPADFPVDFETGQVKFDVLKAWQQHDPIQMIDDPKHQAALNELACLFIDAGQHDEYNLHLGARRFVEKLQAYGIAHRYEEFPGGHRGTSFRYDVAIPALVLALVGKPSQP